MRNQRSQWLTFLGAVISTICISDAVASGYEFHTPLKYNGRYLDPYGISNDGTIVGITNVQGENDVQGFVLRNGEMIPIRIADYSTFLSAINPSGTACVGWYYDDTTAQQRSFEYRIGDGTINLLQDLGGPGADTIARDITDSGLIVGDNRLKGSEILEQGFILDGEAVSFFRVPGAVSTTLTGVNNAGQMVGSYWDGVTNTPSHHVLLDGDFLTPLTIPFSPRVGLTDINDRGQIIGWGYAGAEAIGFVLEGDDYHLVRLPRAGGYWQTQLEAINDFGHIVGGSDDNTHGFIATPRNAIPEPSSLALLLAGAPLACIQRRRQGKVRA